ncbi:hypothetical protein TNCT_200641 [Trichonephila clavata]|uniref:Uncharacterized protein n=1 Tax=Trichonephila clavata TaxID=2740835 RepID=A0A8X6K2D8_TRICU|nr:hypothetical protein TNCT_200641 [Trichonephila clavata]
MIILSFLKFFVLPLLTSNVVQEDSDAKVLVTTRISLVTKNPAEVEDSGNYKCSVKHGNSQSSSFINVTVNTLHIDRITVGIHLCPDAAACEEYCNNFPVMTLKGRCIGNNCECY